MFLEKAIIMEVNDTISDFEMEESASPQKDKAIFDFNAHSNNNLMKRSCSPEKSR